MLEALLIVEVFSMRQRGKKVNGDRDLRHPLVAKGHQQAGAGEAQRRTSDMIKLYAGKWSKEIQVW
jgi:hypothetical protein